MRAWARAGSVIVTRFGDNLRRSFARLFAPPRHRRAAPYSLGRLPLSVGVALLIVGLVASMVWVDLWAFGAAKSLPYSVVYVFARITDFGKSGWFLVPLGVFVVVALALSRDALGRMTRLVLAGLVVRASFVFLAIAIPGLVIQVFKRAIGRARPSEFGPHVYDPGLWHAAFHSLPSGHTTTAFSAAMAIAMLWPRSAIALGVYAVTIGVSRIIVSAHHPSDVLAGAFAGAFGAVLVRNWFASRGLAFAMGPDGSVRAFSGPSLQRVKKVARRIAGY